MQYPDKNFLLISDPLKLLYLSYNIHKIHSPLSRIQKFENVACVWNNTVTQGNYLFNY